MVSSFTIFIILVDNSLLFLYNIIYTNYILLIVMSKFRLRDNSGGGNCAVWAVKYAMNDPRDIREIRADIVNASSSHMRISNARDSKNKDVVFISGLYEEAFGDFNKFKEFVKKALDVKGANQNVLDRLAAFSRLENWQEFQSNRDIVLYIFHNKHTIASFAKDIVLEDHTLDVNASIDQYKTHANQNGVWLNNFEINVYLASRGYDFDRVEKASGTIFTYYNVLNPQDCLYIHNNGEDNYGRLSKGSHWQTAFVIDNQNQKATNDQVEDSPLSGNQDVSGNKDEVNKAYPENLSNSGEASKSTSNNTFDKKEKPENNPSAGGEMGKEVSSDREIDQKISFLESAVSVLHRAKDYIKNTSHKQHDIIDQTEKKALESIDLISNKGKVDVQLNENQLFDQVYGLCNELADGDTNASVILLVGAYADLF